MLKAGKSREGYYTNDDIISQFNKAVDIAQKYFPSDDHAFLYDNATTHTKCPDGSLSARNMPKHTSKPDKNWLVEINEKKPDGKLVYTSDGKIQKKRVRMEGAKFADGSPQSLYFEDDHPLSPGLFKGMTVILQERGLHEEAKLKHECSKFQCPPAPPDYAVNCCQRRVLFNQKDFVEVKSVLKTTAKSRGVQLLFVPKFHCEVNFLEQNWGYAKRVYRHYPPSGKESDLEKNTILALESVPLESMRRYAHNLHIINFTSSLSSHSDFYLMFRFWVRSLRFMDAYECGLDGQFAAWAAKQYSGHRTLPPELLAQDIEEAIKNGKLRTYI